MHDCRTRAIWFSHPVARLLLAVLAVASVGFKVHAQNVFVGSYDGNAISVFGPTGTFQFSFATEGSFPTGIAFDRSGILYVAQRSEKNIVKYAQDGAYLGVFATLSSAQNLNSIAFDGSGNLFVNESNNIIAEITSGGTVSTFATSASGINNPAALAISTNGNLYVGNYNSNSISIFSPNGTVIGSISGGSIYEPSNFAFDATGNLYVGDDYSQQISKVTPLGVISTFANTPTRPAGMAFSSNGDLLVANLGGNLGGGNSVEEYSPTGTDLGVFASGNLNGAAGVAISNSSLLPVSSASAPESSSFLLLGTGLAFFTPLVKSRTENRLIGR